MLTSSKQVILLSHREEFSFVEKVEEEWLCSSCSHPLSDPVFHTICENMFCLECAKTITKCPKCNDANFTTKPAPKNIKNYIDKLKVVCGYCKQQETRGRIHEHLEECPTKKAIIEEIGRKEQELRELETRKAAELEQKTEEEEFEDFEQVELDPLFFNVGGQLVMTNKKYFNNGREDETNHFAMLLNGKKTCSFVEKNGSYFIDCDSNVFKNILEWFKFGTIVPSYDLTPTLKQELLNACKLFKLKNYWKELKKIPINSSLSQLFNNHVNSKHFRNMNMSEMEIALITFSYQYDFINCNFYKALFRNVRFENCLIDKANFAGAKMDSCRVQLQFNQSNNVDSCKFVNCTLDGSTFFGVKKLQCKGCSLNVCTFIDMDMTKFDFSNSFNGSTLKRCQIDLSKVTTDQLNILTIQGMEIKHSQVGSLFETNVNLARNFTECTFTDFTIENCHLENMKNNKFKDCQLLNIGFSDCTFKNKFDNCEMKYVEFLRCTFNGEFIMSDAQYDNISFSECLFHTINFENYQFKNLSFNKCKFVDLNMKNTSFSKCKLRLCDFTNSNLEEAIINPDCETFECLLSEKFKNVFFYSNIIPNATMYNEINVHTNSRGVPALLYRGTRDGFKASTFHELCDNKGPTLTVIQSEFGHIFGGFTKQSWSSTTAEYITDHSAFIFKMDQQATDRGLEYIFCKLRIKSGQHRYAICANSSYLARFGGGNDFCIYDNCNANDSSYSKLGHSYEIPEHLTYGTMATKKYLAGSMNFRVSEIEVYKIDC